MLALMMALAAAPALADAQVSFQSDMPVRFYVDGQRISSTANLKPVELALPAGEHTLMVETMLGRALYEESLTLSDGESVDARWRFRDMEMRSTGATPPEVAEPEAAPIEDEIALAIPAESIPPTAEAEPVEAEPVEAEVVEAEPTAPEPAAPEPIEAEPVEDGLIAVGPPIVEEVLGEGEAVVGQIQLADGELHIAISQGTPDGTRTIDITITSDGVHVFDGEGAQYIDLGLTADAGDPQGAVPVTFISRDGQWANLYIDGALAAYITNDTEASLDLEPGIHLVEIRDSRGRQLWHRGSLEVVAGQALEIGFARDLEPQVMGDPQAWSPQAPVGRR